jgi:D-aminopeptidase
VAGRPGAPAGPVTELHTTPSGKARARALGVPFAGEPGPWNAITDVPGVEVGFQTLIRGDDVRTGVTAIHPRGRSGAGDPVAAGFHSFNGNGEMTGTSWIAESGTCAGPICITNTHAVGVVHQAVVVWTTEVHPDVAEGWLLPVVAETWDGYLNDIGGDHVSVRDARRAIEDASSGPVEEGSVGGGTGMNSYHFKGGSGTASRVVAHGDQRYTVGAFVQTNFGDRRELVIAGVPVGADLLDDDPMEEFFAAPPGTGSVIGIVATDAPLLPDQCRALARRMILGIARTGTSGSHFSGDLFLAVSVANRGAFATVAQAFTGSGAPYGELRFVPWVSLDPFFEAVVRSTEEAVLNALTANQEMVGFREHRSPALPTDEVVRLLRARGVVG